jgi:uncharacterized protein
MKKNLLSALLMLFAACNLKHKPEASISSDHNISSFYSRNVNDTFTVSVSLPERYLHDKSGTYPVIYLLDANLYYDIVAATLKKYAEVGLLPPAILVGIGYKNVQSMDSLRTRDYTFPEAVPEYEMSVSGKADKFLEFITAELIPSIEGKYPADRKKRVLMGHSLGGYFAVYALHRDLTGRKNTFSSYVAASPSTHYNHNYILSELGRLDTGNASNVKCYITFGGMEDGEEEDTAMLGSAEILASLRTSLQQRQKLVYSSDIYSGLGHMDTALPTFIKGLQRALNEEAYVTGIR